MGHGEEITTSFLTYVDVKPVRSQALQVPVVTVEDGSPLRKAAGHRDMVPSSVLEACHAVETFMADVSAGARSLTDVLELCILGRHLPWEPDLFDGNQSLFYDEECHAKLKLRGFITDGNAQLGNVTFWEVLQLQVYGSSVMPRRRRRNFRMY